MPDYAYMAYLDVLGYREFLDADVKSGGLEFKEKLTRAFRACEDINTSVFRYQAISDSIFISSIMRDQPEEFLELLRKIFRYFLVEGLCIRGGASYGQHFHGTTITYSHVLAKAYNLESKIACYPRIMIDNNILDMYPRLVRSDYILKSGKAWFLNIATEESWPHLWAAAKRLSESNKASIEENEQVRAKHWWLQELLANLATRCNQPVPERYLGIFDGQNEILANSDESGACLILDINDRVEHRILGKGTITETRGQLGKERVYVEFDDGRKQEFVVRFASLKKI